MNERSPQPPVSFSQDRFTSPVPLPGPATPRTPPVRPPIRVPQLPSKPRTPSPLVAEVRTAGKLAPSTEETLSEEPWTPTISEQPLRSSEVEEAEVLAPMQAPVETAVSPQSTSRRRDKVLYVRGNTDEKTKIVSQARMCGISISRYLTRMALDKRPPPTTDERRQLEILLLMFKRTEVSISRLQAEAIQMRLFSVLPEMKEDFDAALVTTRGLIRELGKRVC
jgi:hypothetical protein